MFWSFFFLTFMYFHGCFFILVFLCRMDLNNSCPMKVGLYMPLFLKNLILVFDWSPIHPQAADINLIIVSYCDAAFSITYNTESWRDYWCLHLDAFTCKVLWIYTLKFWFDILLYENLECITRFIQFGRSRELWHSLIVHYSWNYKC